LLPRRPAAPLSVLGFPLPCFPAYLLTRLPDDCDRLGNRYRRSGLDDVLEQGAAGTGNQLHDRLVGLDLREHIANGDGLTLLLLPFD
jgi:hypothetical protein